MDMIEFIRSLAARSVFMFKTFQSFNIIIIRNEIILNSKSRNVIKLSIKDHSFTSIFQADLHDWNFEMLMHWAGWVAAAASRSRPVKNYWRKM